MAGLLGGDPSQINLDAGGTSNILQGKLEEADHSSANWYFPKEELERNSPSLKDGIDARRETYFRKSYCTFVQDIGMRLKVPQLTIATAITFCHRFYLRQSHGRNDRFMIATVCMFLAGKVEETPRSLRDVIFVSYLAKNKKDPQAQIKIKQKEIYEQQKDLVLYGERLVLTTLGFDLNVHHPYRPLVAAIKRFKVAQHALAQVAWNFVNDGLRTSLCLQFKPHHIAAGAIFLAAKFLKVKLPHDGERSWWQEFDVTPRQLEEVSNQMLELYEQNRVAPAASNHEPILGEHRNIPDLSVDLDVQQHRPSSHVQNGYINHITAVTEQQHREVNATEEEYPEHSNSRVQYPEHSNRRVEEHTEQYPDNSRKLSEHAGEELQLDREEGVASNKKKREVASASASTVTALTTEEGEVQEHYHGGANKRQLHEDREHNNHRHNNEYHGNYHHQERGRNHVKDKEEREPKKSRHKYS